MKRKIIKKVQLADANKCVISCSTIDDKKKVEKIKEKVGLFASHAYSILGLVKIKTKVGKKVFI